jgi:Mg2+ and Co2+ transporter CorA
MSMQHKDLERAIIRQQVKNETLEQEHKILQGLVILMANYTEQTARMVEAAEELIDALWIDTLPSRAKKSLAKFNQLRRSYVDIAGMVDQVDESHREVLRDFLQRSGKL